MLIEHRWERWLGWCFGINGSLGCWRSADEIIRVSRILDCIIRKLVIGLVKATQATNLLSNFFYNAYKVMQHRELQAVQR